MGAGGSVDAKGVVKSELFPKGCFVEDESDLVKVFKKEKAAGLYTDEQSQQLQKTYDEIKVDPALVKKGEFYLIGKCKKEYTNLGLDPKTSSEKPIEPSCPDPDTDPVPSFKKVYPTIPVDFKTKAGGDKMQSCPMTGVLEAIKSAQDAGLTPLIIDRSEHHLVDTFFKYSSVIFDAKKMALDVTVRKQPLLDVMENNRKVLCQQLQSGNSLVLACQTSCPDFVATFNDQKAIEVGFDPNGKPFPAASGETKSLFPIEVFNGSGIELLRKENLKLAESVFRQEDTKASCGLAKITSEFNEDGTFKRGFNLIVSTHLNYTEIDDFLFQGTYGLPVGKFQAIWIQHEDGTPMMD